MDLKINHIQHIGIPVTDISVSEIFYERLGFKNVMSSTFEHNGEKEVVNISISWDPMESD